MIDEKDVFSVTFFILKKKDSRRALILRLCYKLIKHI